MDGLVFDSSLLARCMGIRVQVTIFGWPIIPSYRFKQFTL